MDNFFTIEQKDTIRDLAKEYVKTHETIKLAVATLNNVSLVTFGSVLRSKYDGISDEMFISIREQVTEADMEEQAPIVVETTAVKDLLFHMEQTKKRRGFRWAISPAGSGKTIASEIMRKQKNVYYVLCDEDMHKADFAIDFARAVGLRVNTQKKARTNIMEAIKYIKEQENALIIFDEADKLSDAILHYFITIQNHLKDVVGVQFLSTDYMAKRMTAGLGYNKKGFSELWSRLKSKFYIVDPNTPYDVAALCIARGLSNQSDINRVLKDVEKCSLDFRRADEKIYAIIEAKAEKALKNK